MFWFGEPWPSETLRAPVCENDLLRKPVPVGAECTWCTELIEEYDSGTFYTNGAVTHKECGLRAVVGPIAFLEGRCTHAGGTDPCHDETLTSRQDALHVWSWVHQHGRLG